MLIINQDDKSAIAQALQTLNSSGIIAFPTETVYGLACDAKDDKAVQKLYDLKQRDAQKPIAVFAKNLTLAKKFFAFNQLEEQLAARFMPGGITLILKRKFPADQQYKISPLLNRNGEDIGLRIPDHPFCLKLLNEFGDGLIAATSANITEHKAAICAADVMNYFQDKIDLITDGGICKYSTASTVLCASNNKVEILREGLIKKA
ncbi:MAG: L-threonylcarbamoyladenylate synthase, partial [Proteobacteria bacterium]|nr:L-threonylcarbamoyladenylate synthase [Pseudomonadota bacterium]